MGNKNKTTNQNIKKETTIWHRVIVEDEKTKLDIITLFCIDENGNKEKIPIYKYIDGKEELNKLDEFWNKKTDYEFTRIVLISKTNSTTISITRDLYTDNINDEFYESITTKTIGGNTVFDSVKNFERKCEKGYKRVKKKIDKLID